MDYSELLRHVDHTLLTPTATWDQVKTVCDEGLTCRTASVCIPPRYVKRAAAYVGNQLKICTVVGFPNGYSTPEVKVFETEDAIRGGADEIDMVADLGLVKSGDWEGVLEEIKAALAPVEWEADAPYCTFTMPYQGSTVEGRFFGNEAALSKVPAEWVWELVRRLPELDRRGLTFLSARAGLGTGGLALERFTIQMDRRLCLFYQRGEEQQMVRFAPDFALCEEDQPALAQPEGGTFLAFVLLEQPEWDAEEFKRTLRDDWGIPCMTEEKDSGEGGSTLVFEAEGFLTAVSLYPFPVPKGEAEQNAGRNYLWSEAEETTRRHRGQILVSTMARDGDVGQAARLQVKLVCAACGQDGVLGIYANGTVYQPEFYLEAAQMMEDGSLPLLNLVWPGLYRREGGLCAYTEGLRAFGKDELEVLDTRAEPGDLRGFVLDIASYVLEQDVTLRDGETIGFSEGQKLPITRSAGIWHDGMTLKIGYPSKEEGEDENSGET